MEGAIGSVACQIWEEASFAAEVGFFLSLNKLSCGLIFESRTLKRLMGIKRAVEARSQSLRPKQRMVVLFKLQEHERKMADLASKFIVRSSF